MATFHAMHECPPRAKTLYLPQVLRHRPVVFNGNFGLTLTIGRCREGVISEQATKKTRPVARR
jgi:hypothetical protein